MEGLPIWAGSMAAAATGECKFKHLVFRPSCSEDWGCAFEIQMRGAMAGRLLPLQIFLSLPGKFSKARRWSDAEPGFGLRGGIHMMQHGHDSSAGLSWSAAGQAGHVPRVLVSIFRCLMMVAHVAGLPLLVRHVT